MSNTGWICPRCQKVHAPFVQSCNCDPTPDLIGKPLPTYPRPEPTVWPAPLTVPAHPMPNGWPLAPPTTCILTPSVLNNILCGDGLSRTGGVA
jgi:hypothetical protein